LNKLYIRFARNARGSGAQRSDAPIALSVKLELPAAFITVDKLGRQTETLVGNFKFENSTVRTEAPSRAFDSNIKMLVLLLALVASATALPSFVNDFTCNDCSPGNTILKEDCYEV